MADIIKFPTAASRAVRVERTEPAPEASIEGQLVRLQLTLDSWRLILRWLDQLAQSGGEGEPGEQSRRIRELIAAAERAIADLHDRHGRGPAPGRN